MKSALEIISLLLCGIIAWQDFRTHSISLLYLVLLLLGSAGIAWYSSSSDVIFRFSYINLAFLLFLFILLSLYFSIVERKAVNIMKKHIGSGDWLFFINLCFYFSPLNFILFFTIGSLTSLLIALSLHFFLKKNPGSLKPKEEIPLAGYFSVFLTARIAAGFALEFRGWFDDRFILGFFHLV